MLQSFFLYKTFNDRPSHRAENETTSAKKEVRELNREIGRCEAAMEDLQHELEAMAAERTELQEHLAAQSTQLAAARATCVGSDRAHSP